MTRFVFFGTPEYAVPSFEALLAAGHTCLLAVTRPDKPRGRGHHIDAPPVKHAALAAGVPVAQPPGLKDETAIAPITAALRNADVGVVIAYGRILPPAIFEAPRHGCINAHASLLPDLRGPAPIQWAVASGRAETGVTVQRVAPALDTGAVYACGRTPVGPDDTADTVRTRLAAMSAALLVHTVEALCAGTAVGTPQNDAAATWAPKLTKADGNVDWSAPAAAIAGRIRGFAPWPGQWTRYTAAGALPVRVRLTAAQADDTPADAPPGTVTAVSKAGIAVATGRGVLTIRELQPESRSAVSAAAFAAGRRTAPGDRFEPVEAV